MTNETIARIAYLEDLAAKLTRSGFKHNSQHLIERAEAIYAEIDALQG